MQHKSRQNVAQSHLQRPEHCQETDFELSEADLEEVVAGNPIVSFNKYCATIHCLKWGIIN